VKSTRQDTLSRHSLRGKITLGYYAVAAIILVASLFFVGELRTLEARVVLGQRATDLFNTALEIRRFERNYFLHHQAVDLEENGRYIQLAQDMLTANRADFSAIATQARLDELQALLSDYQHQMSAFAAADRRPIASIEPRVRLLGQEVVAIAEDMAGSERRQIQKTLASFRTLLLGVILCMAVLIVLIGRVLSQRVVRPLKEMETSVAAISANRRETLSAPSNDREILSIIAAFNHMLKELDLRQKSLMRSERLASLGTMLSGVAHELNNPLTAILTLSQLLLHHSLPGESQEDMKCIYEEAQQATRIVKDVLLFARNNNYENGHSSANDVIRDVLRLRQHIETVSNINVVTHLAEDMPETAIDRFQLQQVFLNIILNAEAAIKDTGRPGLLTVTTERDGDRVKMHFADNGCGIKKSVMPRIFDPFFTTKEIGKGTGLGLSICYGIVVKHGGRISVRSQPGEGATFTIEMPVVPTVNED